jgi:hypothetical protein
MISNRSIKSIHHPVNTGPHRHRCDGTRLTFLELLHTHSRDRHRIRLGITPVEWDLGLGRVSDHTHIGIVTMESGGCISRVLPLQRENVEGRLAV